MRCGFFLGWTLVHSWRESSAPLSSLAGGPVFGVHFNAPDDLSITFARQDDGSLRVSAEALACEGEIVFFPEDTVAVAETTLALATGALSGHIVATEGVWFLPASRADLVRLAGAGTDPLMGPGTDREAPLLAGVSAPVQSFLRVVSGWRPGLAGLGVPFNSDLVSFLEEQVLDGHFVCEAHPDEATGTRYAPRGSSVRVPIPFTSALVSGLMPLALALIDAPDVLIYEEPEVHLDPRSQRIVAQILVRLVRRGTRVLMTTHSTPLVQQINNLLKRGALGEHAPVTPEYGPEDVLHPDEVAAYAFRMRVDGLTEVVAAHIAADGISPPTFNRALPELAPEHRRA